MFNSFIASESLIARLGVHYAPAPSYASGGLLRLWEAANSINPVLVWNQPHMIWLADAQRRAVNATDGGPAALALVKRLWPLVLGTADFIADFPYFNETSGFYELGPPLLGAEEYGSNRRIYRPTYETVYFAYALDIANEWRVAQGMPENSKWARVAAGLGNLALDIGMSKPTYSFNAVAACCYIDASQCPPGARAVLDQCSPQV